MNDGGGGAGIEIELRPFDDVIGESKYLPSVVGNDDQDHVVESGMIDLEFGPVFSGIEGVTVVGHGGQLSESESNDVAARSPTIAIIVEHCPGAWVARGYLLEAMGA